MNARRLIVSWQDQTTRDFLPVAELVVTKDGEGERFELGYLEGARAALQHGFQPFLAFPYIDRRYAGSKLFPFFQNRVMPATRPDYLDYVAALGLDRNTASGIDLLGRSEGRRHTDRVETVLAAERNPENGGYVTRFLLRGVRHIDGAEDVIRRLKAGDRLTATVDFANPKNTRARHLRFEGEVIGLVPNYLLADLDALDGAEAGATFTVERVNLPPHPTYHRVLVRLDARWPEGFEPFDTEPFHRYRADRLERLAG